MRHAKDENRLGSLDGLRGLMCLWVVAGHACSHTGFEYIPVLRSPHYAVNGFMIVSGFLMTYHYILRSGREPWTLPSTWAAFWTRRYFRITPLYYTLLIPAWLFRGQFAFWRDGIDKAVGITDRTLHTPAGATNILLHLTYLFGLSPTYHASLILPDWSLSLEMQYYLMFPLLMLLVLRWDWTPFSLVAASVWLIAWWPAVGMAQRFIQPSPLPLSLLWFVIGMIWGAAILEDDSRRSRRMIILGCCLSLLSLDLHGIVLVTAFCWILFSEGILTLGGAASRVRAALAGRTSVRLAEGSYSVYLTHLLILTPLAWWLCIYTSLSPELRFTIAFSLTAVASYGLAIPLERIEKWGIGVGRQLSRRLLESPATASPVPPEGEVGHLTLTPSSEAQLS